MYQSDAIRLICSLAPKSEKIRSIIYLAPKYHYHIPYSSRNVQWRKADYHFRAKNTKWFQKWTVFVAADDRKNNNNDITAHTKCSIALFICELKYPFAQSTAILFICKYFFYARKIWQFSESNTMHSVSWERRRCFYIWKLNIGHAQHLAEREHGYFRCAIKPSAIRYAVRWTQTVSEFSQFLLLLLSCLRFSQLI